MMKPRQLRPGEVVYFLGRQKMHYIGAAESAEDKVHVFWVWNKYKHRRDYETTPDKVLEFEFKYWSKTRTK